MQTLDSHHPGLNKNEAELTRPQQKVIYTKNIYIYISQFCTSKEKRCNSINTRQSVTFNSVQCGASVRDCQLLDELLMLCMV